MNRDGVNKYSKLKDDKLEQLDKQIAKKLNIVQRVAAGVLIDYVIEKFTTDAEDRLQFSATNITMTGGVKGLLSSFFKKYVFQFLGKWIIKKIKELLGLQNEYFKELKAFDDTVEDRVRKAIFLRIGYDEENDAIKSGGYLDQVLGSASLAQKVASLMNQAIASGMTKEQFRKTFRNVFVGRGMLLRDWNTRVHDLFQGIERGIAKEYADQLGLNFAIYSGTKMKRTRPFCEANLRKVFSRDQIEDWKNKTWKGKPEGFYNPFFDLGGYNCRHHLAWISDELAFELLKKQKDA